MLDWLSDKVGEWARPAGGEATRLYAAIAGASRDPSFYSTYGVDDSLDGRFDALMLHTALVVRRLAAMADGRGNELAQGVLDTMFADLDLSLREIGVSENKVGGKVRAMAGAWLGRMAAYDAGVAGSDREGLAKALERNLFRDNGTDALENGLADAVMAAAAALEAIADRAVTPESVAGALAATAGAPGRERGETPC